MFYGGLGWLMGVLWWFGVAYECFMVVCGGFGGLGWLMGVLWWFVGVLVVWGRS